MDTNFPIENLKCLSDKKIGEGTYGKVYDTNSPHHVCKVSQESEDGVSVSFLRESAAMKALHKCSNIINFSSIITSPNKQKMYLPKFDMDLKKFIDKHIYDEKDIKHISYQMLNGMLNAHRVSITHRDLKPQNILINHNKILNIADWGLSRLTETSDYKAFTGEVQTLWYRCPELLLGSKVYNTSIDVWSLGAIIAELVNKEALFAGDCEIGQLFKIFKVCGTPDTQSWPEIKNYPEYKTSFPKWKPAILTQIIKTKDKHLLDLLSKMLTMNPIKRISLVDALNHEYFNDVRSSNQQDYKLINNLSCFNKFKISTNYFDSHTDLNQNIRRAVFEWLIIVSYKLSLEDQSLFLACSYFDLYLSKKTNILRKDLQLVALVCLLLATKICERQAGTYSEYLSLANKAFDKELNKSQIINMELEIIKTLDYDLFICTEYTFMSQLKNDFNLSEEMYEKAMCILYLSLLDYSFRKYNPQDLAIVAATGYSVLTEPIGQIMELIFLCRVSVGDWKHAKDDIDLMINNSKPNLHKSVNNILEKRLNKNYLSSSVINTPNLNAENNHSIASDDASIYSKLKTGTKKFKITSKQLKINKVVN